MNENNFNEEQYGSEQKDFTRPADDINIYSAAYEKKEPAQTGENFYIETETEKAPDLQSDAFQAYPAVNRVQPSQDAFARQEYPQPAVKAYRQPAVPEQRQDVPPAQGSCPMPPASNSPTAPMPQVSYNPYVARTAANQNQYGANPNQNPNQYGTNPNQNNGYYRPPVSNQPTTFYQPPEKKGGKILAVTIIAICAVVAVICIAFGMKYFDGNQVSQPDDTSSSSTQPDSDTTTGIPVTDSMDVATTQPSQDVPNSVYVAEKVRPSVVGVMTYYDGMLAGEGSGVLMSEKDGWTYVVTCAHVINEEDVEYGILLLDGTTLEAELVAFDERTDIGVLKVQKTGLPLADFGDSSTLKIGEPIYAVGNPGGAEYFGSITDGIVASIDRSVTSKYTMTCIQHNAAINPGNSGGALVNSAGQIVGINSSKIASTEYEGMGFAVPTAIAGPVVDALISYGYVPNRPKLGIEYAPVSSYQLYSIIVTVKGLPQGSLVIANISEDSSLVGTDAQVGDLIIGVNGKDMDDSSVLLDLIETGAVGDTLTLNLCRIDKRTYRTTTFDVTITLVEDRGSSNQN